MMVAFSAALLLLANLPSWIVLVAASSAMPRPVRIIDHPTTHSLQIVPRTEFYAGTFRKRDFPLDSPFLRHDDSLRITLTAFDQTFHLHLRPHEEFLHPAARVTYYKTPSGGGEPVVDRVEPLLRDAVKVYQGEVVHEDHTDQRIEEAIAGGVFKHHGTKRPGEIGWARIMVNDQGDPETGREPEYEGAFSYHGVVHHITTKASYLRKKLPFDPEPFDGPQTELIVFRDSDMVSHEEEEALRRGVPLKQVVKKTYPPIRCSHDRLGYNVDTQTNPVLRFGSGLDRAPSPPWYDPLGYTLPDPWSEAGRNMSKVVKRQGDAQGGSGGSNFVDKIGQIAGCPKSQKIVYIGVAADCEYVRASGGVSNATNNILKNFNTVSLLFKSTYNVSIGIIELLVQPPECPATPTRDLPWNAVCNSLTLNERLSTFSAWRGAKGEDGAGLWHLMSACPTGTEVGVAWLGTLCLDKAGGQAPSVVSGTAVSTASKSEWQIIAHEMGHNFGAIHDCADGCKSSDACCPLTQNTCNANAGFLMSPVSSTKEEGFSPCSVGNVCSLMLGNSMDLSCVVDPDPTKRVFSLQQCGNGVVEAGEDCDPGSGPNATNSPCCDAATCKFKLGAQCDPSGSPCCTPQCRFAPSSQVCRPAKDDQCDLPEVCSGLSASCPTDKTMPNGQSCGKSSDGLACANGLCTSISQQCKTVGAALKLSQACTRPNDQSCQVACLDPKNSNQCIVLQSQLIDGSPCGFGGTCFGGSCKAGTLLQTAIAWYTQNLAISIPVTVVVGIITLLILYALLSCMFRCCRRKKGPINLGPPAIPQNLRGARINSNPVVVPPSSRAPGGPLGPPGPPPSGPPPRGPPPGQYAGGAPPMQYPGGQPQMQYGGPPVLPSLGHAPNGRFMSSWDGGRGSPMPGQHGRMMSHDSRSSGYSTGSNAPLRAPTPQARRLA